GEKYGVQRAVVQLRVGAAEAVAQAVDAAEPLLERHRALHACAHHVEARVARSMCDQARSRPSSAMPSAGGLTAGAMNVSMQCATASIPVAAVSRGGRPSVSSGSQIAVFGTRFQLWKPSFLPSSTMTIAPRATSLPVPAVV